jgi:hypothetical protein
MQLPEFNGLFSDKSARIFLIFSSICPNFHGFQNFFLGGGSCPHDFRNTSIQQGNMRNVTTFMYVAGWPFA